MVVVFAIIFCLVPAGIMWLCKRYKWMGKIGPVLILYILGVIIGNLGLIPGLPKAIVHPDGLAKVQDLLSSAMVPLAIPLLLFGCSFKKSETKSQVLALVTGIVAVMVAVVVGYFIFGKGIDAADAGHGDSAAKIGGMLTGVYTGGTVNLAALKTMLGVSEETYLLLNSYDMVISFLFLTFLLSVGIKLLRKFLPGTKGAVASTASQMQADGAATTAADMSIDSDTATTVGNNFETAAGKPKRFSKLWWKQAGILLGATVVIVGISAGVALVLPDGWFMTAFILMITTLGIAASFIKKLRDMKIAEDISMYCIYIFSIVVASMADLANLNIASSLNTLGYLALVIFGSLLLQTLLAKIFRIDADTMVICSTSFICSPPFVPMMATAMKNKDVIITGLTFGIIGYAAGNYLGFLMSKLLLLF